ncbi:MAG TPA: glycosyl hydrolase family 17 protein [Balneolaceae bacterium]|nr:glycosyl hydrolase family 17 protein [Balneolaceae bacterium]
MSFRKEKFISKNVSGFLPVENYSEDKHKDDVRKLFLDLLAEGIYGFCFSLYEEGQKPGDEVSEGQIRDRMKILKPHTRSIRSFSCTDGNEIIPKIAKESGLTTLVGAWIGSDPKKNKEEIDGLIRLAKEGYVDIAAVGNEVLYREDLNEKELLNCIQNVKQQIPDVPVGYVDAYYEFVKRPEIVEMSDVILCNCYPFWEGTDFKYSLQHIQHMYSQAFQAAKGKPVLITETGWPSNGEGLGDAAPSHLNAMKYFVNTNLWAKNNDIGLFYFSSFDESWKTGNEGDVGAYWGIWDKSGNLKF